MVYAAYEIKHSDPPKPLKVSSVYGDVRDGIYVWGGSRMCHAARTGSLSFTCVFRFRLECGAGRGDLHVGD